MAKALSFSEVNSDTNEVRATLQTAIEAPNVLEKMKRNAFDFNRMNKPDAKKVNREKFTAQLSALKTLVMKGIIS